ncbi:MAG: hypothetical protein QOE93_442, partial [Actinomycetota bacterium]|nr:hypothetical protein [Actinomycetota bacterium]
MARKLTVNGLLLAAVLPLLVATIVGLAVLWPEGDVVGRPASLGPRAELVNGTVVEDRQVPCQGSPTGAGKCRVASVRVTEGPEKGQTFDLDLFEGPGQPRLHSGDKVVLGRADDPRGIDYYFSDFQRRTPLLWLALVFAVAVVAVGRLRGLAALVGLGLSFV